MVCCVERCCGVQYNDASRPTLATIRYSPAMCVSCEREARSSSSYCTIGSVPPPQMHTTAHARATGIQSFKLDGDPKKVAWSTQVFSLKSGKVSFVPFFSRFYFFSQGSSSSFTDILPILHSHINNRALLAALFDVQAQK